MKSKKNTTIAGADFMVPPASINAKDIRLVVIDPYNEQEQIFPEHGQFLSIDYFGEQRAFLFVDDGGYMTCDRCVEPDGKRVGDVCRRINCRKNSVCGIEYVLPDDGGLDYVQKYRGFEGNEGGDAP